MPATLLLDTVEGTQFNVDLANPQKVRGGLVTGISGDPATCADQLVAAAQAAGFNLGDTDAVAGKTVYFHRIIGRPVGTDTVAVQLVWDTDFGASPNAYVISYSNYEQAYQTNRIPGTRIPILVPDWTITTPGAGTNGVSYQVKGDLMLGTFSFPMRRVEVSGIKQGAMPPPGTYDGWGGYCNNSPFLSKPKGFWKILGGAQDFHKLQGWFSFNISAVTKNLEDWSEIKTGFSSKFHVYAKIKDSDEQALRNAAYDYGIIVAVPGALRIGPFPLTEYGPIFGFSS